MDEIFKLYNELIKKSNDYSVCTSSDKRLLTINLMRNNKKQEIDSFLGHFVKAFKVISPKINAMNRLVFIKEIGGHIELKEDGYQGLWNEYQTEIDHVIRHFNHIKSIENDIQTELNDMERLRTDKLADTFSLTQILRTPIVPVNANQLLLFNHG